MAGAWEVSNQREREHEMKEEHERTMRAHDAALEADDEVGFVPGADKQKRMGVAWDKLNQEEWGLLTPRTVTGERRRHPGPSPAAAAPPARPPPPPRPGGRLPRASNGKNRIDCIRFCRSSG